MAEELRAGDGHQQPQGRRGDARDGRAERALRRRNVREPVGSGEESGREGEWRAREKG